MTRTSRTLLWCSAAWLAFVWSTRIRNAVGDPDLHGSAEVLAYVLSVAGLIGAGVLVGVALGRGSALAALLVSAGHVAVWAIRVPMIVTADHPVGFKVVHAMLGVVSVGLALGLWRSLSRPLPSPNHGTAGHRH